MNDRIVLDDTCVVDYLRTAGLLSERESGESQPAGDGNINWVRRVRSASGRSWIVKQARSTLEKFPQYRADPARLVYEARYFEIARPCDQSAMLPQVLHFDEANRILVLQDLGDVSRMGESLAAGDDLDEPLAALAGFLASVHGATSGRDELAARFANDQMRRLHGDHIFHLPFRANDFDLEAPLRARAEEIWGDEILVAIADGHYQRYLQPVGALVHADVQSSNVLIAAHGPVLLDAEIAHIGDPAFDVGTLIAHIYLPAVARGAVARAARTAGAVWHRYTEERPAAGAELGRVAVYAGIEMIRRTVGAARVPSMRDTAAALECLELATALAKGRAGLF